MEFQRQEGFFYFLREKKGASDYSLKDVRAIREDNVEISLRRAKFRWVEATDDVVEKLQNGGIKAALLFPSAANLVGELTMQKHENEQLNQTIEQQLKELEELRKFKKIAESGTSKEINTDELNKQIGMIGDSLKTQKEAAKEIPAENQATPASNEVKETPEQAVRRVVKRS